jgi:hypothetical protein
MAVLTRVTDFIPNTLIVSQEVDDEFNQLVNLLSGVSDDNDTILRYTHATDPVLKVDQLGAGLIQQWLQNGSVKSRINNNGSFESVAGPALAASQSIAAPLTIDGATDIVLKTNGYITGYPRSLHSDPTQTGNVGGGLDTLRTVSVPAGSLAANNDWAHCHLSGNLASNDNDKRLFVSVDGTTFLDSGLIDIDAFGWWIDISIIRVSSTSIRVNIVQTAGNITVTSAGAITTTGAGSKAASGTESVADLAANAFNIVMATEATSNDDVTITQSRLVVCQMS